MTTIAVFALFFAMLILFRGEIEFREAPRSGRRTVTDMARAIALAEGFFIDGSLPQRRNNPGAIKRDGKEVTHFATEREGWHALKRQVQLILDDRSSHYSASMTLDEIARIWTGGDNPEGWAATVAREIGVDRTSRLDEVIA